MSIHRCGSWIASSVALGQQRSCFVVKDIDVPAEVFTLQMETCHRQFPQLKDSVNVNVNAFIALKKGHPGHFSSRSAFRPPPSIKESAAHGTSRETDTDDHSQPQQRPDYIPTKPQKMNEWVIMQNASLKIKTSTKSRSLEPPTPLQNKWQEKSAFKTQGYRVRPNECMCVSLEKS